MSKGASRSLGELNRAPSRDLIVTVRFERAVMLPQRNARAGSRWSG
jgi:hypothetical protein